MSFFTNSMPLASALPPLTSERIAAALDRLGINHGTDDDGDTYAGWETGIIYFLRRGEGGEILFTQGFWRAQLTAAELPEAVGFTNDWHCNRFWPRALARPVGDDAVRMETSHIVDYEHGVTDEQLGQHISTAVSSSLDYFEELNQRFPAAWELATADE
ncbi:MAG TPA: YbjN domain-containing protein [Arachnia sp.]|nr:YbjN domain-containing protein [Arachnia sp.]HMR12590.1 YbjN domain-containing protein [Arachnia sp.]